MAQAQRRAARAMCIERAGAEPPRGVIESGGNGGRQIDQAWRAPASAISARASWLAVPGLERIGPRVSCRSAMAKSLVWLVADAPSVCHFGKSAEFKRLRQGAGHANV